MNDESNKMAIPSLEEEKKISDAEVIAAVKGLGLDAPDIPMPGPATKAGNEVCSSCKKTREQVEKEGDKLMADTAGELKCLTCIKKEKIAMLQGVRKGPDKKKGQGKTIGQRVEATEQQIAKMDKSFEKRYVDAATISPPAPSQSPTPTATIPKDAEILEEGVGQDISQIIRSYRSDLIENINAVEKDLRQYFTDKEVSTLKRAVDLPPLTNFMYMVFRFLKKQIIIDHPLTNEWALDINVDKDVLRNRFVNRFLPLFKFSFYIKNSELLEYFLVSGIIVACDLEFMIKEAKLWDRRSERWCATVQAFLVEFLTRDNTFFNTWEMISNSPIEMQKLFSGFISNLSKLASIERRITKDVSAIFDKAFQGLSDQQRMTKIIENFDTKFLAFVEEDSRADILKTLLNDREMKVKPEEINALISRLAPEARIKFLNQLRPSLMPDEIDALVPELAKYRGKIFT